VTVPQAAAVLEVTPALVYRLCAAGRLAHRRIGLGRGTIRITAEDLAAYLESVKVEAATTTTTNLPPSGILRRPPVPDILGAERRRLEANRLAREAAQGAKPR
jgi:excisionase family DNA binding protein